MAKNHEYEVLVVQVDFSGSPVLPLKLFTVTGSVMARVVPIIETGFNTEDAIILVGTQADEDRLLYMDTLYEETVVPYRPISSDIYLAVNEGEEEAEITSGIVSFYCIFAKLSADGLVELV